MLNVPDAATFANLGLSLLQANGTTYTLRRTTRTAVSGKPWDVASTTDSDITVYGMLDDYTERERDGVAVQATDRRYIIAAKDMTVVPTPGDKLLDGTLSMEVVSVRTVRAAATDVLYYLQVRR